MFKRQRQLRLATPSPQPSAKVPSGGQIRIDRKALIQKGDADIELMVNISECVSA
jgi:hypothetical protein